MKQVTPTAYGDPPVPNDRKFWLERAEYFFMRVGDPKISDDLSNWRREMAERNRDRAARCTETSED